MIYADKVGENHVRARLKSGDGAIVDAIAFRAHDQPLGKALMSNRGQQVHAAGTLCIDRWNGAERVQLRISDRRQHRHGRQRRRLSHSAIGHRSPRRTINGQSPGGNHLAKLNLSVAIGDYDRNRPLIDGAVQIDGVDPVFMKLYPEEIFFRAFRNQDFDICECSLSSFTVKTAASDCPYVGVPAFVSRMFRHTSIYVRTDRIKKPQDLKGKKVGVPEYQLTANVWARAILEDDFGVKPKDMHWIRGGIEHAGRPEKITIKLPKGVRMDSAPEGKTISELLAKGEIDGFIAPRAARGRGARTSAGCSAIRSRRRRTITSAPGFSRSCI